MRYRTISIAAVLAAGLVSTTFAFAPKNGGDSTISAAGTHQPRLHRAIGHTAPANAKLGSLAGWQQIWDRDTDVPLRMWGPSLPYFASTADGPTAARAATDFLAAHIALLAPGSAASDFAIIGNQLDPSGTIRTVGFQQYANGLRVEGGTIGITFERDHLVMVSSTALPHVAVRMPPATLARAPVEEGARAFLAGDNIATHVRAHGDRVSRRRDRAGRSRSRCGALGRVGRRERRHCDRAQVARPLRILGHRRFRRAGSLSARHASSAAGAAGHPHDQRRRRDERCQRPRRLRRAGSCDGRARPR